MPSNPCMGVEVWNKPACPGESIWSEGAKLLEGAGKKYDYGMAINPVQRRGMHQVRGRSVSRVAACAQCVAPRGGMCVCARLVQACLGASSALTDCMQNHVGWLLSRPPLHRQAGKFAPSANVCRSPRLFSDKGHQPMCCCCCFALHTLPADARPPCKGEGHPDEGNH